MPLAPLAEVPPIALVASQGGVRLRCPDELADLFERGGRNYVRPFALYRPDHLTGRHAARSRSASLRFAESFTTLLPKAARTVFPARRHSSLRLSASASCVQSTANDA